MSCPTIDGMSARVNKTGKCRSTSGRHTFFRIDTWQTPGKEVEGGAREGILRDTCSLKRTGKRGAIARFQMVYSGKEATRVGKSTPRRWCSPVSDLPRCSYVDTNEKRRVQSSMKLVLTDESIRGLPRREMERRGSQKECNGQPRARPRGKGKAARPSLRAWIGQK
jgi:hypothetical protein